MTKKPNLDLERKFWEKGIIVVGIDEVGRGAVAGPLVVAGVAIGSKKASFWEKIGIDDSKRLTRAKRDYLNLFIKKNCLCQCICQIDSETIDKHGISKAFTIAIIKIMRAFRKIIKKKSLVFFIDGRNIDLNSKQKSIFLVKGDQRSISIASASIIAKVYRDNLMVKLSKKYPHYLWERNKGYLTYIHRQKIKRYGPTKIHRLSFIKRI